MKKNILILFIIPLFSFSTHKYYIALTEIEFKKETQSVQMIMNVFIDDIENVINKEYNIDAQITNSKEIKNVDEYFKKYLNQHFKININETSKNYKYIGKEYEGNIVYFYLEIENISIINSIEIKNDMFIKHLPEQQNIIKIKNNEKKESLFLTQKKDKALLKF